MELQPDFYDAELETFYKSIKPLLESPGRNEARQLLWEWSEDAYQDMMEASRFVGAQYGTSAKVNYQYGYLAAFVSIHQERNGAGPRINPHDYRNNMEFQDSLMVQDDKTKWRECKAELERRFELMFPLTSELMWKLEERVWQEPLTIGTDVQEGFAPGWERAMRAIVSLSAEPL